MAHGYEKPAVCTKRHDRCGSREQEGKPPPYPRIKPSPNPDLNTEATGDYDNKSPTRNESCGTAGGIFGSCWHGFPPGLTVDGLCQFRRRRPPGYLRPHDNLKPEGTTVINKYNSEYTRQFKNYQQSHLNGGEVTTEQPKEVSPTRYRYRPLDRFRLEYQDQEVALLPSTSQRGILKSVQGESGMPEVPVSEQHAKFQPYEGIHRPKYGKRASSIPRDKNGYSGMEKSSEYSKYVHHVDAKRPELVRRPTSLSMEGEFFTKTEKADKFIKYLLSKRPGLIKKPTTLKLEGDMDITTEIKEKFLPQELTKRPPLAKQDTNLHLEGDMEMEPEYTKKFTKYYVTERPPLVKRDTNLRLEGELELEPEYREVFVEFPLERVTPSKPIPNLKPEGSLDMSSSETTSKFIEHSIQKPAKIIKHATNLQLEGSLEFNPDYRDSYKHHEFNVKPELIRQTGNLNLEGTHTFKPDYRESYVAHTMENLRADFVRRQTNLNLEGVHEFSPGYRETFTQHKLEKTEMKKPEDNLKSPDGPFRPVSESFEKFKEHETQKRADAKKETVNILLEGKIEMNPEYKNSYIDFPRSRPVVKKPIPEMSRPIEDGLKQKRVKGEGVHAQNGIATLKTEGKIEINPEYKSSFIDFPREKPAVPKQDDFMKMQDNQQKHVQQSPTKKLSPTKHDGNRFECQPEYRRAYIDYIQREQIDRIRPTDSTKENEAPAVHKKSERAFEVLCTKGAGVKEKPVDGHLVNGDVARSPKRSILKPLQDRSPSPAYRVHIQADDHKVGFRIRRRRSQDIRPTSGRRKTSGCTVSSISSDRTRRFISPSTTSTSPVRRKRWDTGKRVSRKDSARKSFVILPDSENIQPPPENNNDEQMEDLQKVISVKRSSSVHGSVSKEERANWMPPWYDTPI